MSGHTPGPWWTDGEYNAEEMGVAIIAANTDAGRLPGNPSRGMVAWASEILPENAAICEANARLISASPDLLEAAEFARTYFATIPARVRLSEEQKALNLLADAIAKATGA